MLKCVQLITYYLITDLFNPTRLRVPYACEDRKMQLCNLLGQIIYNHSLEHSNPTITIE